MTTEKYNGWKNYETWNVKLWMDNDEGMVGYWEERAQVALDETSADDDLESRRNDAADVLATEIEDWHTEAMPATSGVFGDILGYAMVRVDWHEIANAYLEDVEPSDSGEESDD